MDTTYKPSECIVVRAENQSQTARTTISDRSGVMSGTSHPLPLAYRNEDISESDFEGICAVREVPLIVARLMKTPQRIPLRERARAKG